MNPSRRDRLAFALLLVPYLVLVRRFWFVSDDAYISFRFSRNWADGFGLRYNLGDHPPEEGFSNFLLVACGSIVELLGLSLEFWMPALAAVSGVLLLYLVFRTLRSRFELELPVACLATATLAYAAPFDVWSSSGLETMTYALLLFATFERLVLRRAGPAGVTAGVLAVGVALIRVEGLYWALVLVPVAVLSRRLAAQPVKRALIGYLGVLAVGYGAWFGWKYGYYGHVFSATVHSKVAFSGERLLRGFQYVAVQYLTSLWLFVVVPGVWCALRPPERRPLGLAVAAMPLGFAAYATLVSGDFMTFGRFLVPALPFTALLLGWVLQDLWSRPGAGRVAAWCTGLACIVLALLPGWNVHLVPHALREQLHFRRRTENYRSEFEQWAMMRDNGIEWACRGDALRAVSNPGDSVVFAAIGATGFRSGLYVFDRHGFVSPFVAMREREQEPDKELRSPGHDEPVDEEFFFELGYEPTFVRPSIVEVANVEELVEALEGHSKRMRKRLPADQPYGLRLWEVPTGERAQKRAFFLVWRREEQAVSPRRAKAELDALIARLRAGEAVERLEIAPLTWRVPGLPRWL